MSIREVGLFLMEDLWEFWDEFIMLMFMNCIKLDELI